MNECRCCVLKVKEKYFKTKYRQAGMLLTVNTIICLKLRLHLKFTNKSYTSVIANFRTGLCQTVH